MKRYVLVLFLLVYFSGYSQNTINNYKYVVVPEKFNFLKQNDQYSLNSLTKVLLQDKGFTVYLDNAELPNEVANNKCRALSADVLEKSGMFTTGLTLVLKDCQGNIVFKSKEGKSREKDYKTAYYMALKDAFTSLDQISYAYNGSTNEPAQPVVTTIAATEPIKQMAAPVASTEPVKSAIAASATTAKPTEAVTNQQAGTLYAQAIANGYQLIDTTPKIVLTILKTSAENYFIAGNATANGIVLKKNDGWFFEYYKEGKLISEKLLVKF
ncbi:hypothetical protein [Mucilaginibacter sp. OK098]|uniref:hypothetical protein n=1 Tax=Mucilaginibacter sp. OK098 TaxID=1855297 RepID=UPI0009224CF8|nr:hypothetical protein [Mucilaginibacter sp. OK098]SHM13698.1 hypothetical protein SAMN05216524_101931 [Mucilaginibacter sp. OK098]